mmetsp:Transcript_69973/g.227803  ORF Transcript_69973/g.227803 Transcript_69973/m.227803 type:complete len:466 (-) Transcript_69973:160-1557(-)
MISKVRQVDATRRALVQWYELLTGAKRQNQGSQGCIGGNARRRVTVVEHLHLVPAIPLMQLQGEKCAEAHLRELNSEVGGERGDCSVVARKIHEAKLASSIRSILQVPPHLVGQVTSTSPTPRRSEGARRIAEPSPLHLVAHGAEQASLSARDLDAVPVREHRPAMRLRNGDLRVHIFAGNEPRQSIHFRSLGSSGGRWSTATAELWVTQHGSKLVQKRQILGRLRRLQQERRPPDILFPPLFVAVLQFPLVKQPVIRLVGVFDIDRDPHGLPQGIGKHALGAEGEEDRCRREEAQEERPCALQCALNIRAVGRHDAAIDAFNTMEQALCGSIGRVPRGEDCADVLQLLATDGGDVALVALPELLPSRPREVPGNWRFSWKPGPMTVHDQHLPESFCLPFAQRPRHLLSAQRPLRRTPADGPVIRGASATGNGSATGRSSNPSSSVPHQASGNCRTADQSNGGVE